MAGIGKVTLWWQTKRMSPDRRPGGFAIPQQKNKHTPLLRITNPQSLNRLGHFLTPDYKSGGTPSSMRVPLPIRWWVTTGLATSIPVSALREIIWAIIPATSMNMITPNGTRRCFWRKRSCMVWRSGRLSSIRISPRSVPGWCRPSGATVSSASPPLIQVDGSKKNTFKCLIYKTILKVHKLVVHKLVNFVFLLIFASVIK